MNPATILVWLGLLGAVGTIVRLPDPGPPAAVAAHCSAIEFKTSENGHWYEVNCEGGAFMDKDAVIHVTPDSLKVQP